MTEEVMREWLKRYRYILIAVKEQLPYATYLIRKRKQYITITEEMKRFTAVVEKALRRPTPDEFKHALIKVTVTSGRTDVSVYVEYAVKRDLFYKRKEDFIKRVFGQCILEGLVTEEELWADY